MSNRFFASDNASGVHPEILKAIESANTGHAIAYGDDIYTKKAIQMFKDRFGKNTDVYFVLTGTAANVLSVNQLTKSYHSVIVAETSHQQVHECGAPEKFTDCKYLTVKTEQGKLMPENIKAHLIQRDDIHHSQPKIVSITQPTELGVLYSHNEIRTLSDFVHKNDMVLHMDGARIANAVVALNTNFRAMTFDCGVDVLSFGGTKNGMMMGEAVVFADKNVSKDFEYFRKQAMQLASKMRFLSVQFIAYFENDLWRKNAEHSNQMAQLFYNKIKHLMGVEVIYPVDTNGLFVKIPQSIISSLQNKYFFYVFDELESIVRWMCSYDTEIEEIDMFTEALKKALNRGSIISH